MSNLFPMQDVIDLYHALQDADIPIWLDGGWGVDALLEVQTRPHDDLDIVIEEKNLEPFLNLMQKMGYFEIKKEDTCPWNFVLSHHNLLEIDVHVVNFDANGHGIYGPKERGIYYPAYAFKGMGKLKGTVLPCLTAEYQLESHTGYVLREKDFKDIAALCKKFKLPNPNLLYDL
ncbi:MAG: nucleotidyltransferase domain-containing protein [Legionellaceae bacterium]